MKKLQYMTFKMEVKEANEEEGIIEGYASTFGNVDQGLDIVEKGAFTKSIKENNGVFPILADHDSTKQVGWNMTAVEDEYGLLVKGQLDMNVQLARERFSLAKKAMELGAKMGLSIGYTTIKAEPDRTNSMIRRLKELKLWEYSMVTFPMNVMAAVEGAKSLVGIDKAKYFVNDLIKQGVSVEDLKSALEFEIQAANQNDPSPSEIQSIDKLIASLKNV